VLCFLACGNIQIEAGSDTTVVPVAEPWKEDVRYQWTGSEPLGQLYFSGPDPGTQAEGDSDDRRPLNAGPLAVLALLRVEFCVWSKGGNDQRLILNLRGQIISGEVLAPKIACDGL
jgi:hypothetical protein